MADLSGNIGHVKVVYFVFLIVHIFIMTHCTRFILFGLHIYWQTKKNSNCKSLHLTSYLDAYGITLSLGIFLKLLVSYTLTVNLSSQRPPELRCIPS